MKAARRAASTKRSSRPPRVAAKTSERGRGINDARLLVVVDATESSRRVLQYVGRILAGRDRVDIHLAFITSSLPPALSESGGSELPEREEQIESDLRREQHRWTATADKNAERVLRAARTSLQRAGVSAARIQTCVSSPLDARTAVDEVLLLAQDQRCGTVVVGHHAHTWFRGLGGGHLAEQLVRSAKGLAVWVID